MTDLRLTPGLTLAAHMGVMSLSLAFCFTNLTEICFVQAAVLLLFNATERLSYTDIKVQLNLTDEDIVRLLHSLSCAKYKILNKDPSSKSVGQIDVFEFNTKFTDKMRRIKVQICRTYDSLFVLCYFQSLESLS